MSPLVQPVVSPQLVDCGLVCAGACGGALARFGAHTAGKSRKMGPAAICTLNVIGSLAIGGLAGAGAGPRASLVFGTGFCGAFTTFSTFALDTVTMVTAERYAAATIYVLANNCLSIGGAAAGFAAARRLKPLLLGRLAGPGTG
eukprot:CAMPEP_0119060140 /NCGR_PEP_ID=MMETSP1178-20130426/4154_1 /TAXON_ID=33656 /ORGANISM="unid sp, Strain CCMP2000" /LENGTH=143 /DNA_ID=CAMNT_0007041219 /DNA_START=33 /DNA_END=464 /DNA_ORIENTATION=-